MKQGESTAIKFIAFFFCLQSKLECFRNSALPQSSINGVKEMRGFRETFNISFNQEALGGLNMSDSGQCGSEDDVETSALLVCTWIVQCVCVCVCVCVSE